MQGTNRGWRRSVCGWVGVLASLLGLSAPASALTVTSATQLGGVVRVSGSQAAKAGALIRWEGAAVTTASSGGFFFFSSAIIPADCTGSVSDGVSTVIVPIEGCQPPASPPPPSPPPPSPPPVGSLPANSPGSLLVFPIFDVIGANRTKIRIVNHGVTPVSVSVNVICQPQGTSSVDSAVCPVFGSSFDLVHNQTIVLDVGDLLSGDCATGQGYIVVWAEAQCPSTTPLPGCPRSGAAPPVAPGAFAPISYNKLSGSYGLYYNGSANPATLLCGGVPCSPPAVGPFPDVEAAPAIAIQSPLPMLSFLGTETAGTLGLTFDATPGADYVALPGVLTTDFAAPGAALIAGPSTFSPFIPPDTVSGTELQTNIILLNLNVNLADAVPPAAMGVNAWNWFAIGFSTVHRVLCWERMPINLIDPRLTAAGPFGANYGTIRFTPSPLTGPSSPHLLGVIEEVSTVGRTIRNMIFISPAASPGIFMNPSPAANLRTFMNPQ